MAMYLTTEGMEEVERLLALAGSRAQGVAARALYEGAGIIADEISRGARSIRTQPFKYAKSGTQRDPSPEEKEILIANSAAGIARFDQDGNFVGTSIGYNGSGYANVGWNHMRSSARTNYKSVIFKGKTHTASSTLKWIRDQGGSEKHGLSKDIGRHAQNQKPVGVIANAINSGTSFMRKQPFIRQAISRSKSRALAKIESTVAELVAEMFKSA